MSQAVCLQNLQSCSDLSAVFGSKSLCELQDNKLPRWNEVKELQLFAPDSFVVFSLLSHEDGQQRHVKPPAVTCRKVIVLSDKRNAVRSPVTANEVGFFLENHQRSCTELTLRHQALQTDFSQNNECSVVSDEEWTSKREGGKKRFQ